MFMQDAPADEPTYLVPGSHSIDMEHDDTSSSINAVPIHDHKVGTDDMIPGERQHGFDLIDWFCSNSRLAGSMMPRVFAIDAAQDETAFQLEPTVPLIEHLRQVQERDASYSEKSSLVDQCATGKAAQARPRWQVDPHGLLRREGKVWVPPNRPLRHEILMRNHDDPLGGHFGVDRTIDILKRKYYWPSIGADVRRYIQGCEKCQIYKIRRHKPWGLLESVPVASQPWKHYAMDFITDLPISKDEKGNEYDSVLVIVDRFTKYVQYVPTTKTITSRALAEVIKTKCFLKVGQPTTLITDRGSVFTSQYWSDLCFYLRVDHRFSTAFHPQTDGQTERQNQTLETFLRMYLNYQQNNWCELLPYAEYAYNSKVHATTKASPIQLAFGVEPQSFDGIPDDHWLKSPQELYRNDNRSGDILRRVQGHLAKWRDQWQIAHESLKQAQEAQARWYNLRRTPRSFEVNQEVLLRASNIRTRRPSRKLDARYLGPFRIIERIGPLAYRLDLPKSMVYIHPVFHVSLLEPWESPLPEKNFRPGPIEHPEVEDDRYEVEAILHHKYVKGKPFFEVKWLGWPVADTTWEPEENLDNCEEILKEYWATNPSPIGRGHPPAPAVEMPPRRRGRPLATSCSAPSSSSMRHNLRSQGTRRLSSGRR